MWRHRAVWGLILGVRHGSPLTPRLRDLAARLPTPGLVQEADKATFDAESGRAAWAPAWFTGQ